MIEELRKISSYDPDHLPGEIELIEAFRSHDPNLPQVACFDTAFHHDMPRVAQIVPIPRRFEAAGVRRYGFHGLSYAFLMEELARVAGPEEAKGRVILAHLGNGASLDDQFISSPPVTWPSVGKVAVDRGSVPRAVVGYRSRHGRDVADAAFG